MLFLVGNRRSGTTWLANILNRSKALSLYYEPFEKGLGFFDDFPEQSIYLDHFSKSLSNRFNEGLKKIIQKKEGLWRINKRYGQIFNCLAVNLLHSLSQYGFCYKERSAKQMRVIHQWHGRQKFSNLIEKNVKTVPLIKETRLQLKLEGILKAVPASKMILMARHPYPVIKSTIGWFAKGRLGELRKKIDYFLDIYKTQYALENYYHIVTENINADVESKLLVHWIICNDNLIRVSEQEPEKVLFITYESLCKDTLSVVQRIADFLRIEFSELEDYVNSTSTTMGDHGIVDTKRISSVHYKRWIRDVDEKLYKKIVEYANISNAIKCLQREYYEEAI